MLVDVFVDVLVDAVGHGDIRDIDSNAQQVDFAQEDGTHIRNVISDGADGDLYMTYMFEFNLPDVAAGSADEEREGVRLRAVSSSPFPPVDGAVRVGMLMYV